MKTNNDLTCPAKLHIHRLKILTLLHALTALLYLYEINGNLVEKPTRQGNKSDPRFSQCKKGHLGFTKQSLLKSSRIE